MSAHTPGRLRAVGTSVLFDGGTAGGFDIRDCRAPEANAGRLAACWNACEGMPTEALEAMPGYVKAIHGYHAAQADLAAARTRIAALEATVRDQDAMLGRRPCQNDRCSELAAARALLADAQEAFDEFPDEDHEVSDRILDFLKGGAS